MFLYCLGLVLALAGVGAAAFEVAVVLPSEAMPGASLTATLNLRETAVDPPFSPLESFDIRLAYDATVLSFAGERLGALFPDDSTSQYAINTATPGEIVIGITNTLGVDVAENAVVFELDFEIDESAATGPTLLDLLSVEINEEYSSDVSSGVINVARQMVDAAILWFLINSSAPDEDET